MGVFNKIINYLRPYITVNSQHVDPHDVYTVAAYRTVPQKPYKPYAYPTDKVNSNQYFKRDVRRESPVRIVYKNEMLK